MLNLSNLVMLHLPNLVMLSLSKHALRQARGGEA